MDLKRYRARVRLATTVSEVVVEAETLLAARDQLQAQYGQDAIIWGPVPA